MSPAGSLLGGRTSFTNVTKVPQALLQHRSGAAGGAELFPGYHPLLPRHGGLLQASQARVPLVFRAAAPGRRWQPSPRSRCGESRACTTTCWGPAALHPAGRDQASAPGSGRDAGRGGGPGLLHVQHGVVALSAGVNPVVSSGRVPLLTLHLRFCPLALTLQLHASVWPRGPAELLSSVQIPTMRL